jgi:aminotransferase
MDTTDPEIKFDDHGVCNHCQNFDDVTSNRWFPNDEGKQKLNKIFEKIKKDGSGKEYDCIIGLSGGIDSSYLALVLKDYGLRPLVVHVDAGWNSELAVYNIEQIVKYCNYDLHTHVMNWNEVRDLQLAYLKSGVANQDVVQDHAYFASLYHFAVKNNIKHIISGGNIATESVFPNSWQHSAMDSINLRAIHKKHGYHKLDQYKTISYIDYLLYYPFIKQLNTVRPLNFMPYKKIDALNTLKNKISYKEYGRKHGESRFTKFFQDYYMPTKFNMDNRLPHLSSEILSGAINREEALLKMKDNIYSAHELQSDKKYIAKKLNISIIELDELINSPNHHYSEYKNWDRIYSNLSRIRRMFEGILKRRISRYS